MICWFCWIVFERTSDNRGIGWLCIDGNLPSGQSIKWPYSSQASLWLYSSEPQPLDQCINGGNRQLGFKSYRIQTSLVKDLYPIVELRRGAHSLAAWAGIGWIPRSWIWASASYDCHSFPGLWLHHAMLGGGGKCMQTTCPDSLQKACQLSWTCNC